MGMGYLKIADHFEKKILSGKLRINEKLPSTTVLSNQFKVSPLTVQRAFSRLSANGLVMRKPRIGTVVCGSRHGTKCLAVAFGADPFQLESPFYRLILGALLAEGKNNGVTVKPFYHIDSRLSHEFFTDLERRYTDSEINCVLKLHGDPALDNWAKTQRNLPLLKVSGYDMFQIAKLGAEHILEKGCSKIATLSQYPKRDADSIGAERERSGVEAAFEKFNMEPTGALPVQCGQSEADAYEYMKKLLASSAVPDAVLVLHDVNCHGVIMAILENGLRIPDDIAIVTHANKGAEIAAPVTLTKIQVDPAKIAAAVVRFVQEEALHPGENILKTAFKPDLIPGESTNK